jgi:hypothetical protein
MQQKFCRLHVIFLEKRKAPAYRRQAQDEPMAPYAGQFSKPKLINSDMPKTKSASALISIGQIRRF